MSLYLPGNDLYYLPRQDLAPESFECIIPPWKVWHDIQRMYLFSDDAIYSEKVVHMYLRDYNPNGAAPQPCHTREEEKFKCMLFSGEVVKINPFGQPERLFYIDAFGKLICHDPSAFTFGRIDKIVSAFDAAVQRRDYSHCGGKPRATFRPEWWSSVADEPAVSSEPYRRAVRELLPQEVTLVVGIFFDGTGNNAVNVRNMLAACSGEHFRIDNEDVESILAETAHEKMGVSGTGAFSYTSYYTNVHWLSTLYRQMISPVNGCIQRTVYVEGTGTVNGEPDRVLGIGMGISDTGVLAKTDRAIAELAGAINTVRDNLNSPFKIIALKFDIFGFSRGAAAARHFANRVQAQDTALASAIREGMADVDYSGAPCGVTRFIGIFDTVAAIGTATNGLNPHSADTGSVRLRLRPGVAEKVFHLTARHECRFNFALNSVSPAWPEMSLPGVHADIGGGYLPLVREDLFLSRPYGETVPLQRPDEHTRVWRTVRSERVDLHYAPAMAPLLRNQEVVIETWSDDRMPLDRYGNMQKRSFAALAVRNRRVKNDWSKVALRVMIEAATGAGVVFDPLDSENPALALPAELQPLCDKALAQARAACKKQFYDAFTAEEIALIAPYIHCSTHWNAIKLNDRGLIIGGASPSETLSFPHRPDLRWQRTVYNMDGKKQ
ncbi:phospholipase effector Tle1 domain-containing protein [Erwinia oleae]|uniref:phospholipase effector Tle1 domain-containing protein n=1 Tax=Erwinia oleae TaxID=796334 RepID=UPI00068D0124|nr:DUF2235 domain-containing protein [Erwinia oleae]